MTFREIFEDASFNVWGSTTPSAEEATRLQARIRHAHRALQQKHSMYFMEEVGYTISVVDGTSSYPLPPRFKEAISVRFADADGNMSEPLQRFYTGQADRRDYGESEQPKYFEVVENNIILYPEPDAAGTVYMHYYQYLPEPETSDFAEGATTEDELTIHGADAVIDLATAEMLVSLDNGEKAKVFYGKLQHSTHELLSHNSRRKRTYQTAYSDFL
jgi:hypothetical protein